MTQPVITNSLNISQIIQNNNETTVDSSSLIGGIIGGVLALVLIFGASYAFIIKHKKNKSSQHVEPEEVTKEIETDSV